MDATKMTYPDDTFDSIIDKATLDSILCSDSSSRHVQNMVKEIYRVLKPGGVFLMLSYAKGQTRMSYLQKQEFKWKINLESIRM